MIRPVRQPLITGGSLTRGMLALAGPMFVSAVLQNAQSLIDLFWVGRLGSDAVAALAVSGTALMMLFPAVMGMSTGTVALVSRCVGGGQTDEAQRVAGQSLLAAVAAGVVSGALGWWVSDPLCRLLGATGAVAELAAGYLKVSFLGCFTVFLLFIGNGILQAAGNAMVPMCAMLLANLLNLVLDPVLIFGLFGLPALGVNGAALATVLAQAAAAVFTLRRLHAGTEILRLTRRHWRLELPLLWRIVRIGVPSSGQMLSRSLMALALMRIVAGYGVAAMAGYGIGSRFHAFMLMPSFALGNAAATMVGQNLGAKRPDRAWRASWLALAVDLAILAVCAALLIGFAPQLIRLFDDNPQVVAVGTDFLRIVSAFYLFAAMSVVLGRALQGAGDTLTPMVTTILGLWGVQIPLALLLPRWIHPATDGIWYATAAALTANGLLVLACFTAGRWTRRVV